MITKRLRITDRAIKRHASEPAIARLRDERYCVELRYFKNRQQAAWYLIDKRRHNGRNGRAVWEKLGTWPQLTAEALFSLLPIKLARRATQTDAPLSDWLTFGDCLVWYREHVSHNRQVARTRRNTVQSVIRTHLLPALADLPLDGVKKHHIKDRLLWPLQSRYKLRTVKSYFAVLKAAFVQASKEELLTHNPLAAMVFADFIRTPIKANEGRLLPQDVRALFNKLTEINRESQLLVLMQLAHGTRISETRLAKWTHIDWTLKHWRIPAKNTKTGEELILPLTEQMLALLEHRHAGRRSPWIFPNKTGRGVMSRDVANGIYQHVSGKTWTSHHCRKLARSRLADLGVDKFVADRIINHKMSNLDTAYIHTTTENLKREALATYHAWLDEQGFFIFHEKIVGRSKKQQQAIVAAGWL